MLAKKWCLVVTLTLLGLNLATAAPPAIHPATGEPLIVNCLRGAPTAIDGYLNDWNLDAMTPAVLDVAEQINSGAANWTGAADCSGKFYLMWDDENIYIAVIVKDDRVSNNKTGGDIWNADCVEVFFATTNAVTGHAEHYQYGFTANNQKWNWEDMVTGTSSEPDYLQIASSRTPDGYICEASIEYGRITALDFTAGNTIGFHPVIDDTDATDREIQMTWTSREAHDQSLGYGYLIFSSESVVSAELSRNPSPESGAVNVLPDTDLSWSAGDFAVSHDVYFGTVFADVNEATRDNPLDVLVSQGQSETTYELPTLQYGQTYYWRVDEVNGAPDNTIFKGSTWSFATEPLLYPVENIVATASIPPAEASGGPAATVDGSGLTNGMHSTADIDMWSSTIVEGETPWLQFDFDRVYKLYGMHIWNYNGLYEYALGFGLKDITIEYAAQPDEWVPLGDYQLARATNKATYVGQNIDLDSIAARSIRINVNSTQSGGSLVGLAEIQFLYKPVFARQPEPADGTTDVGPTTSLSWRPGREAVTHQVSFGTDAGQVADGAALAGSTSTAAYNPGPLTLGTTYYWKVDEVNDAETPTLWDSALWSFTVQEFVGIDDFESYTDDDGSRVYQTWLDGYEVTANGSVVGNDNAPYSEKTIIHGGMQSMPFYYNNIEGVTYSEAELDFASPQNWTANGADTFSLYYRGESAGFAQLAADNLVMSGIGSDIWGTTDQFRFVYKSLTGNGSIVARLEYLDNTDPWAKAGVMIRQTLDADSVLVDGIVSADGRVGMQWRTGRAVDMATPDGSNHSASGAVTFPAWIKLTRNGDVFKVQYSADGTTWKDVVPETAGDPIQITQVMPQTVYIGVMVCSHNATAVAGTQMTGIATTGTVSGQWQSAAIGLDQPAGNGIDTFYLAVEDSSGKTATFVNPNAIAVGMSVWQQWAIPLSDITAAGVKANAVKRLILGVGSKTQPSKNVSGVLYIDDIAFGNPIE